MSVTRIEGTRPLEAAQPHTTLHPREPGEPKKSGESDRKKPAEDRVTTTAPGSPNSNQYSLSFRFERELNRVVVKVVDSVTGKLVLEIPPEAVVETLKQLRRAPGGLVDEEA